MGPGSLHRGKAGPSGAPGSVFQPRRKSPSHGLSGLRNASHAHVWHAMHARRLIWSTRRLPWGPPPRCPIHSQQGPAHLAPHPAPRPLAKAERTDRLMVTGQQGAAGLGEKERDSAGQAGSHKTVTGCACSVARGAGDAAATVCGGTRGPDSSGHHFVSGTDV